MLFAANFVQVNSFLLLFWNTLCPVSSLHPEDYFWRFSTCLPCSVYSPWILDKTWGMHDKNHWYLAVCAENRFQRVNNNVWCGFFLLRRLCTQVMSSFSPALPWGPQLTRLSATDTLLYHMWLWTPMDPYVEHHNCWMFKLELPRATRGNN